MTAPKRITAKHLQKITTEYEAESMNRIVESVRNIAQKAFASNYELHQSAIETVETAIDLQRMLHELHDAVAAQEKQSK